MTHCNDGQMKKKTKEKSRKQFLFLNYKVPGEFYSLTGRLDVMVTSFTRTRIITNQSADGSDPHHLIDSCLSCTSTPLRHSDSPTADRQQLLNHYTAKPDHLDKKNVIVFSLKIPFGFHQETKYLTDELRISAASSFNQAMTHRMARNLWTLEDYVHV